MAENRLLSGYLDPDRFAEECQRNPFLRMLGLNQSSSGISSSPAPYMTFAAELLPDQLLTRIHWFSAEHASQEFSINMTPPEPGWQPVFTGAQAQPVVIAGHTSQLSEFLQQGQRLFSLPAFPFPFADRSVYEESLECRMSERLTGMLYMLPETVCTLETKSSGESRALLDDMVQTIIDTTVPPLVGNRILRETEAYKETTIARIALKMPLVQQEILQYAVTDRQDSSPEYTILSNSGRLLRQQLDNVLEHPENSSDLLSPAPAQAGFLAVINPVPFSEVFRQFAQTPTFVLMTSPETAQLVKQNLPLMAQGLQLLPVTTVAGGTAQDHLVVEIRGHAGIAEQATR
jgi:hypothetical protein